MVERTPVFDAICQAILFLGLLIALVPFAIVIIAATHDIRTVNTVPMPLVPGRDLFANLAEAWQRADLGVKLFNSVLFATAVACGKVILSAMAAFSIVYFRFPGRSALFWAIFVTLMLPLEVRIVPTYAVAANALAPFQAILDTTGITWLVQRVSGIEVKLEWGLLNSYPGLILPLVATATGTFLYRQFYLTIPDELAEAAKMDGSGPVRFFVDMLLPLSRPNMIALFTIMFVWSWNQYLWPLLVTTDPKFGIAVTELRALIPSEFGLPDWNVAMAGTLIIMLPPLIVVILMQRWFVRGLISTEK
ncbi:ABC transporter permease subunit [Kaistia geumhonensis]|uniref:sn-glycerol-3-phosphate transport system permease protein UgpE n=1 Tax=Kaistia geumhonensis TaxID=410839 RepID=A0ABU0M676_9HYPH|nr:ABC transporter permease subunit [Kaistia geumhonensis]MCX5478328.1 ABC transporter permease subunit [Kaistia geumhonensis]MDQ0516455.1 sn-glycerol 3-phosphate transport system permease protein [Kaistia geumhonensis]